MSRQLTSLQTWTLDTFIELFEARCNAKESTDPKVEKVLEVLFNILERRLISAGLDLAWVLDNFHDDNFNSRGEEG